jgi:hypothetical protein
VIAPKPELFEEIVRDVREAGNLHECAAALERLEQYGKWAFGQIEDEEARGE